MKYLLTLFMVGMMLASINTHAGGPGRGFSSSGSRSSFGGGSRSSSFGGGFRSSSFGSGFRSSSSPSYRSFSPSPSRTFTYRSSAPSASAPRYSAPAAASRSTYRSKTKTTVNNHYHGGTATSGGGLGLMDYVILDNMLSRDRGPGYVSAPARTVVVDDSSYVPQTSAVVYQSESHFWRNFLLFALGAAFIYGIYRLCKATETAS